MNQYQILTIQALHNMKGDNTTRARYAWHDKSPEYMAATHGASGKSRATILAEYEAHDAKVDVAIAWVKSLEGTK